MFETEKKTFAARLPALARAHPAGFALVKGERVEVFAREEEAIRAGIRQYGDSWCFLVRQIAAGGGAGGAAVHIPAFRIADGGRAVAPADPGKIRFGKRRLA